MLPVSKKFFRCEGKPSSEAPYKFAQKVFHSPLSVSRNNESSSETEGNSSPVKPDNSRENEDSKLRTGVVTYGTRYNSPRHSADFNKLVFECMEDDKFV
ncbi:hypothetical protein TNCV_3926521 [Trichonephila clavipes]|nr:hypothetical protein TNCV_3926521 [Trichonephila clavipes]